jgi:ribosomal protein S18 acetylase RimI-like enzyme
VPEPPSLIREPTRVWHLELAALRPARGAAEADVRLAEVPFGPLNRFFYLEIGRDFHWVDRLGWAPERWQAWAESVETWLVHDHGTPAGYAELRARGGAQEIAFFGLLEPFRDRGLGGALLTRVAERALARAPGATVRLDTCELDGPQALEHYRARGFEVVRETVEIRGRLPGAP